MEIKIESTTDLQRMINMSRGEIFIWHIEQHLLKDDRGSKDIPPDKVGCKICGKTVEEIFLADGNKYYDYMHDKYKGKPSTK